MMDIVYSRTSYRLTDRMHEENPDAINKLSDGHAYDMSSNILQRLPDIFFDDKPDDENDYIQILGRDNGKRVYKYIRRDYVKQVDNLDFYKLYVAQANGSEEFGEAMSDPVVEAQEGVDTIRTDRAFSNIARKHTLYLSGTPFKALANEQFSPDQIFL